MCHNKNAPVYVPLVCLLTQKHVQMGGAWSSVEDKHLKWIRPRKTIHFRCYFMSGVQVWWHRSFLSLLSWLLHPPPVALLYWLRHPHVITFSLYSQPCGPEHTLHLIREYYLTLGGQHSSTSWGFCQQCISFCGCPKSISVVPAARQGTLCDLCHLSSTQYLFQGSTVLSFCWYEPTDMSCYQFYLANILSLCSHLLCECGFGSYIKYAF